MRHLLPLALCTSVVAPTTAAADDPAVPEWVAKYRRDKRLSQSLAEMLPHRVTDMSTIESTARLAATDPIHVTIDHAGPPGTSMHSTTRIDVLAPAIAEPTARRTAISTDPVGLVTGTYTLSVAWVLGERTAIRVNAESSDVHGVPDSRTWSASISAPIYLDRALHGPFIEPGVVVAHRLTALGLTQSGELYATHDRMVGPQIFVGWQWMLRSGLHIAGAIGASRNWSTSRSTTSVPVRESYLRVGYAF